MSVSVCESLKNRQCRINDLEEVVGQNFVMFGPRVRKASLVLSLASAIASCSISWFRRTLRQLHSWYHRTSFNLLDGGTDPSSECGAPGHGAIGSRGVGDNVLTKLTERRQAGRPSETKKYVRQAHPRPCFSQGETERQWAVYRSAVNDQEPCNTLSTSIML